MSFELVTFDEMKKALKLEKGTIDEYPPLVVLKASVEQAIEEFLGRELEQKARTEAVYINGSGGKMVNLKATPISSVATVTLTDAYGNTETLTNQSDYRVTPWGIRLFSTRKDVDVSVTYTGGYTQAEIPGAISRAALLQTIHEHQKAPHVGAEMVQSEGGSVTYPELGLLNHVKQLLAAFIHPYRFGVY